MTLVLAFERSEFKQGSNTGYFMRPSFLRLSMCFMRSRNEAGRHLYASRSLQEIGFEICS